MGPRHWPGCGLPLRGALLGRDLDAMVWLTLNPGEDPLSFSPGEEYLATASADGAFSTTVKVLDVRSGDVVVAMTAGSYTFQGDDTVA